MKAYDLSDALRAALFKNGKASSDAMVLLDGNVYPIKDVAWHDGHQLYVIEVELP